MQHEIYGNSRVDYWQYIASRINNEYGENFTYQQCRNRFNTLVREFYVSKILLLFMVFV
jgi:hypothetical protein